MYTPRVIKPSAVPTDDTMNKNWKQQNKITSLFVTHGIDSVLPFVQFYPLEMN